MFKYSEVFDRAADIIEAQGWGNGEGWNIIPGPCPCSYGCGMTYTADNIPTTRCAEGAIEQALGINHLLRLTDEEANTQGWGAIKILVKYVNRTQRLVVTSGVAWNDEFAGNLGGQEYVVRTFREIAAEVRRIEEAPAWLAAAAKEATAAFEALKATFEEAYPTPVEPIVDEEFFSIVEAFEMERELVPAT